METYVVLTLTHNQWRVTLITKDYVQARTEHESLRQNGFQTSFQQYIKEYQSIVLA